MVEDGNEGRGTTLTDAGLKEVNGDGEEGHGGRNQVLGKKSKIQKKNEAAPITREVDAKSCSRLIRARMIEKKG